jgi:hypothetical protein
MQAQNLNCSIFELAFTSSTTPAGKASGEFQLVTGRVNIIPVKEDRRTVVQGPWKAPAIIQYEPV